MRFARDAAALLLVLAVAGCGDDAEQAASVPDWEAPDRYAYTLENRCGERALIGQWRIDVADGEVIDAEGLDDQGQALLDHGFGDEIPTITDLLDEASHAQAHDAEVVDVRTTDDGRPTAIDIDWDVNADDDETCFRISDYTTGS